MQIHAHFLQEAPPPTTKAGAKFDGLLVRVNGYTEMQMACLNDARMRTIVLGTPPHPAASSSYNPIP